MSRCNNYEAQRAVCIRKVGYNSKEEADRASKNHSERAGTPRFYSYECPVCFGWHLATLPEFK